MGNKFVDGKAQARGRIMKKRSVGLSDDASRSALAAEVVKKHCMQLRKSRDKGGDGVANNVVAQAAAVGKRRRPKLVHYVESGDPLPARHARYAPGSRLGNLTETELSSIRKGGASRPRKMNVRGRANLVSFFISADGIVRAACSIAMPLPIGTGAVLVRDRREVHRALDSLENKRLGYLDGLMRSLRHKSSIEFWSRVVLEGRME